MEGSKAFDDTPELVTLTPRSGILVTKIVKHTSAVMYVSRNIPDRPTSLVMNTSEGWTR